MVLRRFGMVAALLAAVCCGALLTGCANGDDDESEYEKKKALDYWNKDYKADDYEWQDITDDNKDEIVGTWKAVYECTKEALDKVNTDEDKELVAGEIGFYTSIEFVIDDSFKNCKFTFISDSSKCKSKIHYKYHEFPKEFVNGEGYKYNFDLDDKNYIATATAENLTLEQLIEVLRCEGLAISTTKNRLLLKDRPDDTQYLPATWIFAARADTTGYVIARAE